MLSLSAVITAVGRMLGPLWGAYSFVSVSFEPDLLLGLTADITGLSLIFWFVLSSFSSSVEFLASQKRFIHSLTRTLVFYFGKHSALDRIWNHRVIFTKRRRWIVWKRVMKKTNKCDIFLYLFGESRIHSSHNTTSPSARIPCCYCRKTVHSLLNRMDQTGKNTMNITRGV
jgi:hypothetical protein